MQSVTTGSTDAKSLSLQPNQTKRNELKRLKEGDEYKRISNQYSSDATTLESKDDTLTPLLLKTGAESAFEAIQARLRTHLKDNKTLTAFQYIALAKAIVEAQNNDTAQSDEQWWLQYNLAVLYAHGGFERSNGFFRLTDRVAADQYQANLYLMGLLKNSKTDTVRTVASATNFLRLVTYKGVGAPKEILYAKGQSPQTVAGLTYALAIMTLIGAAIYYLGFLIEIGIVTKHYFDKENTDSWLSILQKDNRHHRMFNYFIWALLLTPGAFAALAQYPALGAVNNPFVINAAKWFVNTFPGHTYFFPLLTAAGYLTDLLQHLWKANGELSDLYAAKAALNAGNRYLEATEAKIKNTEKRLSDEATLYFAAFIGTLLFSISTFGGATALLLIAGALLGIACVAMSTTFRQKIKSGLRTFWDNPSAIGEKIISHQMETFKVCVGVALATFTVICLAFPPLPVALAVVGLLVTMLSQSVFLYMRLKRLSNANTAEKILRPLKTKEVTVNIPSGAPSETGLFAATTTPKAPPPPIETQQANSTAEQKACEITEKADQLTAESVRTPDGTPVGTTPPEKLVDNLKTCSEENKALSPEGDPTLHPGTRSKSS